MISENCQRHDWDDGLYDEILRVITSFVFA